MVERRTSRAKCAGNLVYAWPLLRQLGWRTRCWKSPDPGCTAVGVYAGAAMVIAAGWAFISHDGGERWAQTCRYDAAATRRRAGAEVCQPCALSQFAAYAGG